MQDGYVYALVNESQISSKTDQNPNKKSKRMKFIYEALSNI